jgi:hypothetical protein
MEKIPLEGIKKVLAGCQWLTPIILATQETESRRSAIQSQPEKTALKTLSQKTHHKKELVECLKV